MSLYRKGLKGKLDRIFSLYIRQRDNWICQKCDKKQKEGSRGYHCAHIVGRAKESTRWDEENAYGICYGCHFYLDTHPAEKIEWYRRKYGERQFDDLIKRSTELFHYKKYEIQELIKFYENQVI